MGGARRSRRGRRRRGNREFPGDMHPFRPARSSPAETQRRPRRAREVGSNEAGAECTGPPPAPPRVRDPTRGGGQESSLETVTRRETVEASSPGCQPWKLHRKVSTMCSDQSVSLVAPKWNLFWPATKWVASRVSS